MQQLSGLDTSFLSMESSTTVGHVTGVLLLDPGTSPEEWTFDRFQEHLLGRIAGLGPFTRKLVEVPLGLDRPYWVHDNDFDIDYHLRHVAVPGKGAREDFSDLVARIHARPLDRRRPLWEAYVVDGVHGDQMALVTKIHHAAIDGVSGQQILSSLVDVSPDSAAGEAATPLPVEKALSQQEILTRAMVSLVSSPVRVIRAGVTIGKAMPVIGPAFGRAAPVARGDESTRELVGRAGGAPRTPFNATIGPHRRYGYVSISLEDVKAVKNAAGATVNDVVLALVAGVLRRWLERHGGIPDRPLAAMVPLSVRRPDQADAIGNFVANTVSTLATHLDSPKERLAAIHESMAQAKQNHEAMPADILTDLTQMAPPAVTALAARLVASTKLADRLTLPFNVVVSNVPGPPVPLYLAGAQILANYPVSAIVDGVGLNITVQSTNGMLDFGFVSDRDLIDDLWEMADLLEPALRELAKDVSVTLPSRATSRATTKRKPAKKVAAKKRTAKKARAKKTK